ncbi:MAG: radical SAM protein [Deltaproteobacteria bacterium]|nr:MAG: radical SAM protein [Deltaproteobacteria bacterium]
MEKKKRQKKDIYMGFEQGPIRPPSEADSLLLRLTRNCPWNLCTFCRIYKRQDFSLRSVENILQDIDLIHTYVGGIRQRVNPGGKVDPEVINTLYKSFETKDRVAFNAAMTWYASGMESIFLQDANSVIMKPDDLVFILEYIRHCFPETQRITSYARSHTLARIKDHNLERMARAGLNRIHVGMETGSDQVLKRIRKGASKEIHIRAGLKVKAAGMELSEYVMPGIGGIDLSIENAMETASALNIINPDFIRVRTLAVTNGTPLARDCQQGSFEKPSDTMMVKELRLFLESLDGIDSQVKSDHILNLFETINGKLPEDKERLIRIIDSFFEMPEELRILYQVGRRMGFFRGPADMEKSGRLDQVKQACKHYGVTPENVDTIIDALMKRFV